MIKRKFQLSGATKAFRTRLNNKQIRSSLKGLANSLRSERGESIMEVVVSILIFSILMTTALAIVRTSLIITGNRIAEATTLQEDVNRLVLNDAYLTEDGTIRFSLYEIDDDGNRGYPIIGIDGNPAVSSHDIVFSPVEDIFAFRPPS